MSQYPATCLFSSNLKLPNGQPAQLYDASCAGVIDKHFQWMQQFGIDGVVVQRFLSALDDNSFITVLQQVQAAAQKYGRGFIVEYDASGGDSSQGSVAATVMADFNSKVKPFLSSSAYIHQNGKPVVMVFGIGGFSFTKVNVADATNIVNQLKGAGNYVGISTPTNWANDAKANTGYASAYKAANLISPWTVGSYSDAGYVNGYHANTQIPDAQ